MIVLALIMVALQVRAHKPTDNNAFIDEHFIKDNLLVMASGAVYGSVIETICYKFTLPDLNQAYYCKIFAAESLALINLLRAQQPAWALEISGKLNLLLVAIASGHIGSTQSWPETISKMLAFLFCYQLSRISGDCATCYLWKPDLDSLNPVLISYVVINGVSTGLLIGGLVLWQNQNLEGRLKLLVSTLASTGTALLSTVFYMIFIEPEEKFSISERVVAIAIAGAGTAAAAAAETAAGAGAVIAAGTVAGAIAGAIAGAGTGTIAGAGAAVVAAAAAATVAEAGLLIISTTRFSLQRLSNGQQPYSISHSLAQVALISVPLLVSSWLVSVNQWIINNVSAHETMQGVYYPDVADAIFSGEWIKELYHLLWRIE